MQLLTGLYRENGLCKKYSTERAREQILGALVEEELERVSKLSEKRVKLEPKLRHTGQKPDVTGVLGLWAQCKEQPLGHYEGRKDTM